RCAARVVQMARRRSAPSQCAARTRAQGCAVFGYRAVAAELADRVGGSTGIASATAAYRWRQYSRHYRIGTANTGERLSRTVSAAVAARIGRSLEATASTR